MASPSSTVTYPNLQAADESDYGSDFSSEVEEIINHLLLRDDPEPLRDIEDDPVIGHVDPNGQEEIQRIPWVLGRAQREETVTQHDSHPAAFDTKNSSAGVIQSPPRPRSKPTEETNKVKEDPLVNLSPLERFRSAPRKAFSVSDLVAPAWCELQYWYTLKYPGRKETTEAMKQGTKVHEKLEKEVYTTVKVDILTKEDAWGLRIWNVIQGLRTLQEIGYTRELEVWGIIDGCVVNGIIDEISFTCPEPDLETKLLGEKKPTKGQLPPGQTTISSFLKASGGISISDLGSSHQPSKSGKIYICDVKTRSHPTLPKGASFRPTKMQLMLYHHLLSQLATNHVDFSILLDRYKLDGNKLFSDSFITQIGNLNDGLAFNTMPDSTSDPVDPSSQDSVSMLLSHNSLSRLWSLMISIYQKILPNGRDSIGKVLRAEYRSSDHGRLMGSSTLAMDDGVLNLYLDHQMKWWRGEREPLGVVMEEAYKCQRCEFADKCEWRLAKVEEARAKAEVKARKYKKAMSELERWEGTGVGPKV